MKNIKIPLSLKQSNNVEHHKTMFEQTVRYALENNEFYKQRYSNIDLSLGVPIITRDEIYANNELQLSGHEPSGKTSGSTGHPLITSWCRGKGGMHKEANTFNLSNLVKGFRYSLEGKNEVLITSDHDNVSKNKKDKTLKINVRESTKDQYTKLKKYTKNPTVIGIKTYPSNLELLCKYVIRNNLEPLHEIELISIYSEGISEVFFEYINKVFPNIKFLWHVYSSCELGTVGINCAHSPHHYHILEGVFGFELLNDNDEPVEVGEVGRIIVTDYYNTAGMYIRYDTGDMAIRGESNCGDQRFTVSNFIGKRRGFLKTSDGEEIMFTNLPGKLKNIKGLIQYQIIQEELSTFNIRIVVEDNCDLDHIQKEFTMLFNDFIGGTPTVKYIVEKEIEKESNGKFYVTKCLVPEFASPNLAKTPISLEHPNVRSKEALETIAGFEVNEGDTIVDIQAADGYMATIAKENIPFDVNIVCVEPNKKFHDRIPKDFTIDSSTIETLESFPDNSVDAVIGLAGIHHAETHEQCVKSFYRILKEGKYASITDVEEGSPEADFLNVFVDKYSNGHDGKFINPSKYQALCEKHGFEVIDNSRKEVPWVFDDIDHMLMFTKTIFNVDCDEDTLLKNLNQRFEIKYGEKVIIPWALRKVLCKK